MKIKILILTILLASQLLSAQTRGTSPGELYFYTTWYYTGYENYDMILHTTNHGKNFKPTYVYKHDSGETPVGNVMADATPGVLYNQNSDGLNVSFDSGITWELNETPGSNGRYATGSIEGVIYKCCASNEGYIWKSYDFGSQLKKLETVQNVA